MKVYKHRIEISFKNNINKACVTEFNIIAENEKFFVIDDNVFQTYQHKKEKGYNSYTSIDEISITDWSNDKYFQQIIISMLTKESDFAKVKKKISKQFDKWLYEKHGRFVDGYNGISEIIESISL